MKSTIHEHQKNNLKNVSKTSIIFLGLVAWAFTTTQAANEFKSQDLDQQELSTLNVETSSNKEVINEAETAIFNPASVIKTTYVKTIEDVIAENKLITESQEEIFQPLSIATTIEDRIAEDNQIIESTISNNFFLLDFEKINAKMPCVRVYNNNATITVDLKL